VLPNDDTLDGQLASLSAELSRNGVARQAFEIAVLRLSLARRRGAGVTEAMAAARAILPQLRKPLDAPDKLL
jgi:hypothetical protein